VVLPGTFPAKACQRRSLDLKHFHSQLKGIAMTDKPTLAVKREQAEEIAAALRSEYASPRRPSPI
jgi:hypothetical protein